MVFAAGVSNSRGFIIRRWLNVGRTSTGLNTPRLMLGMTCSIATAGMISTPICFRYSGSVKYASSLNGDGTQCGIAAQSCPTSPIRPIFSRMGSRMPSTFFIARQRNQLLPT
jgi:hypothetical protein